MGNLLARVALTLALVIAPASHAYSQPRRPVGGRCAETVLCQIPELCPESRGEYDELLFGEEADVFEAEHLEEEHWEGSYEGRRSDWSIRKIISWVFSAFILMSITSSLCESIIG